MIEDLRSRLEDFVSYEEGKEIRKQLEDYALRNYRIKHPLYHYLEYMNQHECSFERNHPQSTNEPYVWTMFSVPSQHVMGDCIEECLDKALEKAGYK